jgi:hypothetical protein
VRDTIFQTNAEMPPKSGSSLAVRTAQTRTDYHENLESAMNVPDKNMSVVNLPPVNRGKHY